MYADYWGLTRRPFEEWLDPAFFVRCDTHQAALLKLRYLIESRLGAGLLSGDVGCGKSAVIDALAHELSAGFGPFPTVVYPKMSAAELLAYLAVELGAEPLQDATRRRGVDEIVRHFRTQLQRHADAGRAPVIVIDEAHLIDDPDVFETLRLLLNFRRPGGIDFTLIFVGDLTLIPQVQRIAALEDRIAVKCLMQPLTQDDTIAYVDQRLSRAGAARPLFDDAALVAVHELTGGLPRRINRLCDLALLVGYADGLTSIGADQIEAVADELVSVVPN